jgi:nucleoside-diphosphate-sugar epimerase
MALASGIAVPTFSRAADENKSYYPSMRRVLVTGTSGFIASHLAETLLRNGAQVLGLDKRPAVYPLPGARLVVCDLLDRPTLTRVVSEFRPDTIFHLAARADLDDRVPLQEGYAANIRGVEHLMQAIGEVGDVRRCVVVSTQMVCPIGYRPTHDQDFCPNSKYGESKVLTEQIVRRHDGGGTEWCLVRPTTVWGPRMNPDYLRFFRLIRTGSYVHVGARPIMKTYGYVGNVVYQMLALAAAPADRIHRRVFYTADYQPVSVQAWAEAFQKAMGAPPIRTIPLPIAVAGARMGDLLNGLGWHRFPFNSFRLHNVTTSFESDLGPIREVCGELPFALEEGAARTVDWVRETLDAGNPVSPG